MNSNYLRSIRIVYFALATGIIFFMLVALFLNFMNGALAGTGLTTIEKAPFMVTLIVLTGAVFIAYRAIFPKKLIVIQSLPTLDKKLAAWRELNILQGALIEAPAFFAVVLFMLLGVKILLIWPVVCFGIFWITQPTREKLIEDANLTPSETDEFDRMN